jgi:recombination protein RecA
VCQPDSGEQALEIADTLVQTGSIGVIVIDSVAALVPRQELEGEMGQQQIGLQARLMSQALRKLTPIVSKTNTMVIFINQIRMKIGVMFGNPETTSGGVALKYYSSVRLDIRKIGSVKKGDDVVANQLRVKVSKNKVAPPFRTAEFDIEFGKGLSKSGEIIDLGLREKIIEKSGAWYAVTGTGQQLGQGREKAKQFLEQHPDVAATLEKSIRDIALSHKNAVASAGDDDVGHDEEGGIDALLDTDMPPEATDRA